MTGLSAIKQTLDITKDLRSIEVKIDVAEVKLRLADLVERLLEAKEALQDAKETERNLRAEIEQLKADLGRKAKLVDMNGLLFEADGDGALHGAPYCNLCYVREGKLFRLLPEKYDGRPAHRCLNCRSFLTNASDAGTEQRLRQLGAELG